jgi:hypothetical protein
MDKLRKPRTPIEHKINDLADGYNINAAALVSLNAGNVGETVTALGTNFATAKALSTSRFIHKVLGADDTVGVALGAGVVGQVHIVINTNATSKHLHVYPIATEKIDSGSDGVSLSLAANRMAILVYKDGTVGWASATVIVA